MVLDREEEAKRIMMGGAAGGQGYGAGADRDYYGGPGGADGGYGGMGNAGPSNNAGGDMGNMGEIQPKARKMAAAKKQDEDDDNWGNVDALLE